MMFNVTKHLKNYRFQNEKFKNYSEPAFLDALIEDTYKNSHTENLSAEGHEFLTQNYQKAVVQDIPMAVPTTKSYKRLTMARNDTVGPDVSSNYLLLGITQNPSW